MNLSPSLIDFSTPRSSVSNRWTEGKIRRELFDKFRQHEIHWQQTQNSLNEFDRHLANFNEILQQLKQSTRPLPTDELELRVLQMSTKREQIRSNLDHTLNASIGETTRKTYGELIKAIESNLKQKFDLTEKFVSKDKLVQVQHRHELLRQHLNKLLEQQRQTEESLHRIQMRKPQFDHHAEQMAEFQQLNEEFENLYEENRLLKRQAKENVRTLYNFLNELTDD